MGLLVLRSSSLHRDRPKKHSIGRPPLPDQSDCPQIRQWPDASPRPRLTRGVLTRAAAVIAARVRWPATLSRNERRRDRGRCYPFTGWPGRHLGALGGMIVGLCRHRHLRSCCECLVTGDAERVRTPLNFFATSETLATAGPYLFAGLNQAVPAFVTGGRK